MAINVEQFLAQVDFRKSRIPILSFLGIFHSGHEQPRDLLMWYLKHCKIWTSWKKQFVTKDFCRWLCPTNVTAPHIHTQILKKILPCHNGIKIIMYEKMTLSLDIVITFKVRDGMPPFYSERTIVHVKRWPRWRTVKVLNRRNIWMCVC